jgi:hypothetical protein
LTSPSKAPSKYHSGFASQEVKKVKILWTYFKRF